MPIMCSIYRNNTPSTTSNVCSMPDADNPFLCFELTIPEVTIICNALSSANLAFTSVMGMVQEDAVNQLIIEEAEAYASLCDKLKTAVGLIPYGIRP